MVGRRGCPLVGDVFSSGRLDGGTDDGQHGTADDAFRWRRDRPAIRSGEERTLLDRPAAQGPHHHRLLSTGRAGNRWRRAAVSASRIPRSTSCAKKRERISGTFGDE